MPNPKFTSPAVSSGADMIERWLQAQPLVPFSGNRGGSYAVGGRVVAASGYLMCVPYLIAEELVKMLPLRILELPDGVPDLDADHTESFAVRSSAGY